MIKILDMANREQISTSFPRAGIKLVGEIRDTPEGAYEQAVLALRAYEARDPYGNMGDVCGVAPVEGGYRGVINTYHSNT